MSIQISVDPAGLSQEQREAVAGFILAFPCKACGHVAAVNEMEALQHEHESTMPEAAFGKPEEASTVAPPPPITTMPEAAFGKPEEASTVAPPPPITTTPGVELDSVGLPWDGRIHAESKSKIVDGSWRKKRQIDPALVSQVEAELRQVMGVMGAAPAAPLVPVAAIPDQPTPGVAPAGEVPQDARQQFVNLVGRTSAAIQAGKVSLAEVNQICADSGIPSLPLLANRPDLVATVASRIDALIEARGQ